MQQGNSPATSSDATPNTKQEDERIWEKQNFMLGCFEMERITDDILVPIFQRFGKSLNTKGIAIDIVLMDCESPIDGELYNVGVRLSFTHKEKDYELSMVADPSDFSFTLQLEGVDDEPLTAEYQFHEAIPRLIESEIKKQTEKHFPFLDYSTPQETSDQNFENFEPPFRVQYDDHGNVSDVATTQTLAEAAKMGGTFAKMFKTEEAITIIDANDQLVC